MHGIVLAGGRGRRIESLTRGELPKPMLDVDGRPFLAHHLDWLVDQGVSSLTLAVCHLWEVIRDYFGAAYRGVPLLYSHEREPAGTGGAIAQALDLVAGERHVVATNGDTYFPIDLARLAAFHRERGAEVTLALAALPDAGRYGAVEVAPDGRIRAFREKGVSVPARINAGVYCIDAASRSRWPRAPFSFETDLLARREDPLRLFGLEFALEFTDIGVPEDYRRFCERMVR